MSTSPLFSPLFFYGQIVFILALALTLAAHALGYNVATVTTGARSRLRPHLDRQRSRAIAMGWDPRTWLAVRVVVVLVGLAIGLALGTPVVIVGGVVAGIAAVPFVLGPIADQRKVRIDHALIDQVRQIVDLVRTSNQTLDDALADAGTTPQPLLRHILAPLAQTELSVRDRLIEVDRRAASPIANRVCADLLLSLDVSPAAFIDEAAEVLIPQYEADLILQDRNNAVAAGARTGAYLVAIIMGIAFVTVMRVDSFRTAYSTPGGQVVLVVVEVMVMAVFWVIDRLTPKGSSVRWDLAQIKNQMERRYA